jgi:phenylalanyl-tRNA synthetase alpha chain
MDFEKVLQVLSARAAQSNHPQEVLRAPEIKTLYDHIKTLPSDERGAFGKRVNELKKSLEVVIEVRRQELDKVDLPPIDVTAPMDINAPQPELLPSERGTIHPLSAEIERISDIFNRMGFVTEESREIDDQFHMFESLNFPKGHPARDDYDTFMTEETDANGDRLIAPAHTSTMQNRVLKKYHGNLENGEAIAAIVPDRVFRN